MPITKNRKYAIIFHVNYIKSTESDKNNIIVASNQHFFLIQQALVKRPISLNMIHP